MSAVTLSCFVVFFVVGLTGNGLAMLLLQVQRSAAQISLIEHLLFWLSVIRLFYLLLSCIPTLIYEILGKAFLSDPGCKGLVYFYTIFRVSEVVITLLVNAYHCAKLQNPIRLQAALKFVEKKWNCLQVVVSIIVLVGFILLPLTVNSTATPYNSSSPDIREVNGCYLAYVNKRPPAGLATIFIILFETVPFVLLLASNLYFLILLVKHRRKLNPAGPAQAFPEGGAQCSRGHRLARCKMILAASSMLIFSWFINFIISFICLWGKSLCSAILLSVARVLYILCPAFSPYFIFLGSRNLRGYLKRLFC
ncbi:taste receptor type 2 member 140-like [Erpetoichthys calabaricus]|uniref:taste receptor type 2 member 140-like n=1 Tax=Erpetoichthys calabaricus TaxID=27687 RepID=UPI00109FCF64|nr:taste receptor type 2 member 140-like [Erpetoichthys calabaricus]